MQAAARDAKTAMTTIEQADALQRRKKGMMLLREYRRKHLKSFRDPFLSGDVRETSHRNLPQ
jgi:hypothetical protein